MQVVLVGALALQLGIQALIVLNLSDEEPGHPSLLLFVLTFVAVVATAAPVLSVLTHGPAWLSGLVLVAVVAVAIELLPEKIDVHESWMEQPNSRSACRGLTYTSYPWGQTDSSETVWCVGWETPLPPG